MDRKIIMSDLREIRYYYLRRAAMEEAEHTFRTSLLVIKVRKYADVMEKAPIRLYDLYAQIIVRNVSQVKLAEEWNYSLHTIHWWMSKLYEKKKKNL